MLQGASTDLFIPLVPKAHNSDCQNIPFLNKLSHLPIGRLLFSAPSAPMG